MKKTPRLFSAMLASVIALNTAPASFGSIGTASAAGSGICINEICSQNKSCLTDSYGSNSDWIELYNSGSTDIDLGGYGITDDTAEPLKFVFPKGTVVKAGEYFVIFASKRPSVSRELHTGFSISKNGETIALSDPSGNVLQKVDVPTLGEDMSYGRTPDGGDTFEIMAASPAKANAAVVSAPVFSAASGFYGTDLSLSLTAADGTLIYYTTDGTDPKTSNTAQVFRGAITVGDRTNQPNLYSAYGESDSAESICRGIGYKPPSFNVDKATVVRAAARDADGRFSSVVSQTYFITSGNLSQYKNATVVSLVTDPDNLFDPETGIYVTGNKYMDWKKSGSFDPNKSIWDTDNITNYFSRGKQWERSADITIFENGSPVVEQGMGIRIKGASTRNHAQKSFNLYARSEYGASKIEYPLFADNFDLNGELVKKYDSISLRSVVDETRINDSISQGLIGDMELATQSMKPCVVFLNGEYWGMYEMTERLSDYFIESNFDVPKQDVAMIKSGESEEGPEEECRSFLDFADQYASADLTNASNYKAVCDFIDIDSMIEHYAAGLYLGTYDWPNFNYGVWRNMGEIVEGNKYSDGKWRFITYDLDYTMGTAYEELGTDGYAYDSFKHMGGSNFNGDAPTNLFINLLRNKEFRNKFAGAYCDLANEVLTPEKGVAAIDVFANSYTDMLAQNLLRWWGFYGGDPAGTLSWNKQNFRNKVVPALKEFFNKRSSFTLDHMKSYLGLSGELRTITLKTGGHGSIRINTITPDLSSGSWSGKYYSDCPVTVTAVPDEGYSFAGWKGDASGSEQTITLTLSKAMSIQADFTEKEAVKGDVNADGSFDIADVVSLQNYVLGRSKTLADWKAGDLCKDNVIDSMDIAYMRRELIKSGRVKRNMTADELNNILLSKDEFTWSDFEQYKSEDIGSGRYWLRYEIDTENEMKAYLNVLGSSMDEKPDNIFLGMEDHEDTMDIYEYRKHLIIWNEPINTERDKETAQKIADHAFCELEKGIVAIGESVYVRANEIDGLTDLDEAKFNYFKCISEHTVLMTFSNGLFYIRGYLVTDGTVEYPLGWNDNINEDFDGGGVEVIERYGNIYFFEGGN